MTKQQKLGKIHRLLIEALRLAEGEEIDCTALVQAQADIVRQNTGVRL